VYVVAIFALLWLVCIRNSSALFITITIVPSTYCSPLLLKPNGDYLYYIYYCRCHHHYCCVVNDMDNGNEMLPLLSLPKSLSLLPFFVAIAIVLAIAFIWLLSCVVVVAIVVVTIIIWLASRSSFTTIKTIILFLIVFHFFRSMVSLFFCLFLLFSIVDHLYIVCFSICFNLTNIIASSWSRKCYRHYCRIINNSFFSCTMFMRSSSK